MLIHESFDKTLRRYSISAKALSRLANISEAHVSQFRNGKGGAMSHTTLEDILNAMEQLAPGSKSYFYILLAGKSVEQADIDVFVQSMDDVQLGSLLTAIAKRVSPQTSPLKGSSLRSTEQVAV
jgi:DNA-binding Xre family transcriptional regulator